MCGDHMNMPPTPSKVGSGANFVRSDPHLLVLNYFVLLVVLAPPQVLILRHLTPLNLLTTKKQMRDDSFTSSLILWDNCAQGLT